MPNLVGNPYTTDDADLTLTAADMAAVVSGLNSGTRVDRGNIQLEHADLVLMKAAFDNSTPPIATRIDTPSIGLGTEAYAAVKAAYLA